MKILTLLGLDPKSKDKKAQERKARELSREQDILINELSAQVDSDEVKKEELENLEANVDAKQWVKNKQELEINSELNKKKLQIAQRTKEDYFTDKPVETTS